MLLQLNDDCLLQIVQLLPLKDQLQLTEISERFEYLLVKYIWSKKYCDLHTQMRCLQPLSLQEYKKFFRLQQENIRKLEIEETNNFAYVYNSNRLCNRPDYTFYFGLKMSKLKELHLNCANARVYDKYIEFLSKCCPKLEVLDLGRSLVTGAHIEELASLKLLTIGSRHIQMPLSVNDYEDFVFAQ